MADMTPTPNTPAAEAWIDIAGYDGIYQVSNLGNVRKATGKPMTPQEGARGHYKVGLNKGNRQKRFFVHRLVAKAFLGESDLQVNHINGDPKDNRIENLEYVTNRENSHHRFRKRVLPSGVVFYRGNYKANIQLDGRAVHIGIYENMDDASTAYKNVSRFMGLEENYAR